MLLIFHIHIMFGVFDCQQKLILYFLLVMLLLFLINDICWYFLLPGKTDIKLFISSIINIPHNKVRVTLMFRKMPRHTLLLYLQGAN
jgi:hypothetical protein